MSDLTALLQLVLSLLLTFSTTPRVSAADPDYLNPQAFVRRRYHASAKIGNWIYIDGGEFSWRSSNGTIIYEATKMTHSIDMSMSWTNSSVVLRETDRGDAPLLNMRTFWVDESSSTIYPFGGEHTWLTSGSAERPQPWKFVANGNGSGSWAKQDSGPGFSSLVQPAAGSHTYGNGIGYYLGGHLLGETWPSRGWYPVNGLVAYNMSSNTWTNSTPTGYGKVPHHAIAHFVPSFGSSGVVVWMGGLDSTDTEVTPQDPPHDFANITVYDTHTNKWFYQEAIGTVPAWRNRACAVGVQGENNTYEIFIYAGANVPVYGGHYPTPEEVRSTSALDEVYILTLPAFVWFKANYTSTVSRQGHTCHVVGNRQLLTIGGIDPAEQEMAALIADNATDPFSQGLGIFDLTKLTWSDEYVADESEYQSPQVVSQYYQTNPRFPQQWNSDELKKLFRDDSAAANSPSPTVSMPIAPLPTPPNGQSGSLNGSSSTDTNKGPGKTEKTTTVIAGATVGSVVAIAIVGGAVYFLVRLRRTPDRKRRMKLIELDSHQLEELSDSQRYEIYERRYWELPAPPPIPKLKISEVGVEDQCWEMPVPPPIPKPGKSQAGVEDQCWEMPASPAITKMRLPLPRADGWI